MCIERPSDRVERATRHLSAWLAGTLLIASPLAQATPDIQTWNTENGTRVLFVAAPEIPMVDARLVLAAGSARDGQQPGLASMTADMLSEGAGDWNADVIADRLDGVGAILSASADRDMTMISLRTLTRQPAFDTAVDTFATLIARPTFAPDALERVRQNRLIALRQDEESPRSVAQKALYRAVFGAHPYATDPSGTPESIATLPREALVDFHARHYVGANAVLALVGDLDRAGAEALAKRLVAGLPSGEPAGPLPEVPALAHENLETIAFPSSQTTVLAGQPGMRRGDPDYFTLYVGNHILGGSGLVSILMDEIREKRGLSYSTYSYFLPLAQPGPFLMSLQTRNDQAKQALAVLLDTLKRFINQGPTEAELTAAKKNITGGFPLKIASNSNIVQYLAVIGFYDLPLDYLDRFRARIEVVTTEQIRDAFARRVHPERLAIVTVGAPSDTSAAASAAASEQGPAVRGTP
ncbi:M16 family metallopeptidase [Allochromatium palmeri]|uniref:Insulinase family protein n=1 Tax=Allochromatium palmeri TaxID=231048 RepID=A0A6N8ECM8_9GAMM|nr:pitrilysin family protein [Allochromatium palmeri]MTW20277.1 insulinase family protein [Allochromatium palmeri]